MDEIYGLLVLIIEIVRKCIHNKYICNFEEHAICI
jgi:hypothetical protein